MISPMSVGEPRTARPNPFHTIVLSATVLLLSPALLSANIGLYLGPQITPNPNPELNTITVTTLNHNNQDFLNEGYISVQSGTLTNLSRITNEKWATIYNEGSIENEGTIENKGSTHNWNTMNNSGHIQNNAGPNDLGNLHSDHNHMYNFGNVINTYSGTIENLGAIETSWFIQNMGTITNLGGILNTGTIQNWNGTIDNHGVIDNRDIIDNPFGIFQNHWGYMSNSGTINNAAFFFNDHGAIDNWGAIQNSGTMVSDDTIFNYHSGNINNSGTLENRRWINNYGTIENLGIVENEFTGVFVNDGVFDNTYGVFHNRGTFQGTGTYYGTFDTGSGILSPGNSAGTLSLNGGYLLGDGGTLEIEIGGFDVGEFDLLDITGTASLTGGTIRLLFLDDYDISSDVLPGQSMSLMFLEADGGIASFASTVSYGFLGMPAGFIYDVFQEGSGLWFRGTNTNDSSVPVPVPGAGMLAILGLSCAGIRLKREHVHKARKYRSNE